MGLRASVSFTLALALSLTPACKGSNGGSSGASASGSEGVPKSLALPETGDVVLLRAYAKGVQVYSCDPSDAGTAFAWTFREPKADLYSDAARITKIGSHFAGPTWSHVDGSSMVASTAAKETVDAASIPWLLLKTTSTTGTGVLTKARFVQRVETSGGLAPASGCDATKGGAKVSVPYQAVYVFYGA